MVLPSGSLVSFCGCNTSCELSTMLYVSEGSTKAETRRHGLPPLTKVLVGTER